MEECLQLIDQNKESENDAILIQIARSRMIVEKVINLSIHESVSLNNLRAPIPFHIEAIRSQLQEVKALIPLTLQQNGKLSLPVTIFQDTYRE